MTDERRSTTRVSRSRQQARVLYDRLSRWYDLLAARPERRFLELGLQELAVREGETVLEVGVGTGHGVLRLAQAVGASGRVYGLDLSQGMLEVARSRLLQGGLGERVDLRLGDALAMPFAARSVDAVLMTFTLELFDTPDVSVVLAECREVLRPGGRMAVVAMSARGRGGPILRLYEWAHQQWPSLVDCRPIDASQALQDSGLVLVKSTLSTLYGLPVEITVATEPEELVRAI